MRKNRIAMSITNWRGQLVLYTMILQFAFFPCHTAEAQEADSILRIVSLPAIEAGDTLLYGACALRHVEAVNELVFRFAAMAGKEPDVQLCKQIMRWIASSFPELNNKYFARLQDMFQKEGNKVSNKDSLYALKREIASLMIDGKLHNWVSVRSFCHGRAAVCQKDTAQDGSVRIVWGFVDERMNLVIPCHYVKVHDFNNRNNIKSCVYDCMEDMDNQGWTTVFLPGWRMGMIDRNGHVKIPFLFTADYRHHHKIVFVETPWGDFAPVYVSEKGKEGIIDRNGRFTLRPKRYDHIVWYNDIKCFGTTGDNPVYFNHRGKRMKL